jgi:hypothetical protein
MPHVDGVRAMLGDFQDFIQQGNMIDLAVGLILGSSFSAILNSFVVDILSPIISLFSGEDAKHFATFEVGEGIVYTDNCWVWNSTLTERSLANYYWPARCPATAMECSGKTWETWKQGST